MVLEVLYVQIEFSKKQHPFSTAHEPNKQQFEDKFNHCAVLPQAGSLSTKNAPDAVQV